MTSSSLIRSRDDDVPSLYDRLHEIGPKPISHVPIIRDVEDQYVGLFADLQTADMFSYSSRIRRVDRSGCDRLGRSEVEVTTS